MFINIPHPMLGIKAVSYDKNKQTKQEPTLKNQVILCV